MKFAILSLIFVFGTAFVSNAQKYGYIDSDFILNKMPEYKEAKERLDKLAIKVKKENFIREEDLLPKEEREKRQKEIADMETEAMEMQKARFGVTGDYFQKRQELIKPIQDKVFEAMQTVASKRNYAFVFDKANQSNLVFADAKFDLSDEVIKELGINTKNDK
jgi:outer membrane protein